MSPKPPDILRKSHAHTGRNPRAEAREALRRELEVEETAGFGPYSGGCHCGALVFAYRSEAPPASWAVHACQCSFCRRHGAATTADPGGSLELSERKPGALSRYRFGERTADFLVCSHCGVYLGAVIETAAGLRANVNLNTLDQRPDGLPAAQSVSYAGERPEVRRERRARHWTPAVWR